jgi:SAM-dependent methyltransferase
MSRHRASLIALAFDCMMLSSSEYIRERLAPRPGDPLYLHLVDLLEFIKHVWPKGSLSVLDYGAGGSPYRSLFESAIYHRADLPGGSEVDIVLTADCRLPQKLQEYDVVLSTQVLEHVEDPLIYLKECLRALKPSGMLILTTHGIFEDHPCPVDFHRWTADGLVKLVSAAGFVNISRCKLTTGPRAVLFLLERQLCRFPTEMRNVARNWAALPFRLLLKIGTRRLQIFADRVFAGDRLVNATGPWPGLYIGIGIVAQKRSAEPA